jgi:hypothetical protein
MEEPSFVDFDLETCKKKESTFSSSRKRCGIFFALFEVLKEVVLLL